MYNIKISNLIKTSIFIFLLSNFSMLLAQDSFGGLALYTVRGNMGKNSKATLQAVAEAGYVN
ncbi:MAG: sugar phosphate isomerase/epimerase family protein, partial [Flavobacteriaceae bacterium]